MEKTITITGVVAEYNGKYWGIEYADGHSTSYDFGDLENAQMHDPEFCKKPTDMTHDPRQTNGYNPNYNKLLKAKLVIITKTTTTTIKIH
jgi:hypothetical protein